MIVPVLDGTQLKALGREMPLPFKLSLIGPDIHSEADVIECRQIFRLLPGRRLVCLSSYQGKQVIAKLFIHPEKSVSDLERELKGYRFFFNAGIPTPKLMLSGRLSNGGFYVLYDYIADSISPGSEISLIPDAHSLETISKLIAIIARMHNADLQQVDLHLNNFLYTKRQLYAIDCSDVVPLSPSSTRKLGQIYKNCADILSQLPVVYDPLIPDFLHQYHLHAHFETELSLARMYREIDVWRKWRISKYLKKAARNCSEFIAEKEWSEYRVYRREYSNPSWMTFFARLDEQVESSKRLKDGNTATVVLAECEGKLVVIKRYNIKDFRHLLSRFWRPSRGWTTWKNAHCLKVLGIRTPKPIAIIEKRFGCWRHKAFYLSEYEPASDVLSVYSDQDKVSKQHLADFSHLFSAMINAGVSHGDLKANNILLTEGGISLIDLDAMKFHADYKSFMKYFSQDIERFLRNWSTNKRVKGQFEKLIASLPRGKRHQL